MQIQSSLFKPIDHVQITVWRILFGLVLVFECFGSNLVGWTKEVFTGPPHITFNFIGFDWLQPIDGIGMFVYFGLMGLLAIAITLGWHYRIVMPLFTLGWAGLYFMHKTSYNNHHYLMLLLCILMTFTPANANLSMDAKQGRTKRLQYLPAIFKWQFLFLFLIVYTYASVAKWYPDWMSGRVSELMFSSKKDMPVLGAIYRWELTPLFVAWGGILYDLFVIPALLYKPTRKLAFITSIAFHIFNSVTFQIGTFPYMMIGASVLFFPPATVTKLFRIKTYSDAIQKTTYTSQHKHIVSVLFCLFMLIQVMLPLRHFAIPGNVFYTEEGHRLSWRMMLRIKYGNIGFNILKKGQPIAHDAKDHLTVGQYRALATHPDMIWQYCQYLKKLYGQDIEIYVNAWVSLNNRPFRQLIDPNVDMAKAPWHVWGHEDWINPCNWKQINNIE
jgi:hypothetical protein